MIKVFIDFKNAYDSVIIVILLEKLKPIMSDYKINLIKSLFLNGIIIVKVNNKRTSYINRTNGLMQGSILSPILFNYYVNDLCCQLNVNNILFNAIFYK